MTTFQDLPPQSRRAIRLSERAETNGPQQTTPPESPVTYNQFTGEQPPVVNPTLHQTPVSQPSGRRSRAASPDGLVDIPTTPPEGFTTPQAEPLTYATQGSPVAPEQASPPATPTDQPYRVRDFSPEGRRAAQQPAQPTAWQNPPQQSPDAAPLDYRTQAGPPVVSAPPAAAAPEVETVEAPAEQPEQPQAAPSAFLPPSQAAPQPTSHAVPVSNAPVEQTLTRRELRAQLAAAEAAAAQASGPFVAPPLVEPEPETPSPSALSNAMAEFDALTRPATAEVQPSEAQVDAEPTSDEQVDSAEAIEAAAREAAAVAEAEEREAAAQAERERVARDEAAREEAAREEAAREQAAAAERHAEAENAARQARELQEAQAAEAREAQAQQLAEAQARAAAQAAAPVELAPQFVSPDVDGEQYAATTGHWSRQADLDDETQPYENTISRDVGGGNVATTTSALVLPVIPPTGFSGPFGSTGEILVTGSIDLPRSLGTTGGDARRYDDPDVDNLFDAFDNEIINTDSAPVRAIRAVSTHTSTHGVIHTTKPQGNRMLTGLLITTGSLAVVVVGLLITAFATGVF